MSYENIPKNAAETAVLVEPVTDFLLEVAQGNIAGKTSRTISLSSTAITNTGFLDVWGSGTDLVYPTAAETWEIVSSSTADTNTAGTGARKVLVNYLDASYVEKSIVVNLNGTTPVVLNADHFRPNGATVIDSGSGQTNAGLITIRVSGGGNPRQFIPTGFSISMDSHITVPAGKKALTLTITPLLPKNEDAIFRAEALIDGTNTFITVGQFPFYQSTISLTLKAPFPLPEKSDLRIRAKSGNVGPIAVDVGFELLFVET